MLLAIDSATQMISIALHNGGEVLFEQTWRSVNRHTVELGPAVAAALARHQEEALSAVAVVTGPGTYTGLRVGVSFAKAVAAGRRVPLVGVGTLDITAAGQPNFNGNLIAFANAGRSRIVAGLYQWRKGRWRARTEPVPTDWESLLETFEGPTLIAGELDTDTRERLELARAGGVPLTLAPPAWCVRRASFLADEAWQRLQATTLADEGDDRFDPALVTPVYVKTKDSP
jgi:tRNA threonylcarbamoyladenosine biosynthesis protein TsaB